MKWITTILSLTALSFAAMGQDELPDSALIMPQLPDNDRLSDSVSVYVNFDRIYTDISSQYQDSKLMDKSGNFDTSDIETDFTPGVASIAGWRNGIIYASGGIGTMPGLMAINSGSINVMQNFGRLTVSVYGTATKYGYFNGLETSYGVGGELSYRFSDKVNLTLFGAYHSSVRLNQPAMAGYANIPHFGGYVDYSFSERFGVEVGAQGYHSMITKRIEAQPIIRPYFKLSKNNKIGFDIGGILYQMLNSRSYQHDQPRNPTIGPPVQKLSQAMGY